jgi:hypothetical protein
MLWMKAWLETRWRFLYALGGALTMLVLWMLNGVGATKPGPGMMIAISLSSIFAAIYLAGSGVKTQTAFQMTRGLQASTYYTLSLPVSRFRLLAVRAGCGLLETTGINAIVIGLTWSLFPLVRANSTELDLLKTIAAAAVCTACIHLVSVFLATFLEETWHLFGSIFFVVVAWWSLSRLSLRASFNVFRFLGDASPLITHGLPWPAMGISLLSSAILFLCALKVVQSREY